MKMSIVPNPSELDRLSPLFVFGPDSMNSNKIKTSSEYIEILIVTSFSSSIRDKWIKTGRSAAVCGSESSLLPLVICELVIFYNFKLKYQFCHYFDEENLVELQKVDILIILSIILLI